MRHPVRFALLATGLFGLVWMSQQLLWFENLEQPRYLFFLLGLPLMGGVFYYHWQRLRSLCQQYAEFPLLAKMGQELRLPSQLARLLCFGLILTTLAMALSRPQSDPVPTDMESSGIDILVAVDVSNSTRAEDVVPNRLEGEKSFLSEFLQAMISDRVGLLVFSDEAFPLAPLTNDYSALETLIPEINPELLPGGGTNLPVLFRLVRERFKTSKDSGKLLVILSDGENQVEGLEEEMKQLKEADIRVMTVGFGTTTGAKVPAETDFWGNVIYKTHDGQDVVSKLDEKTLQSIASMGGGSYFPASRGDRLLNEIKQIRKSMVQKRYKTTGAITYQEKFQWYLLLAILLMAVERALSIWQIRLAGWKFPLNEELSKLWSGVKGKVQAEQFRFYTLRASPFYNNQTFLRLMVLAREDQEIRNKLYDLLHLEEQARQLALAEYAAQLRAMGKPDDFIQTLNILRNKAVAQAALEYLDKHPLSGEPVQR